jgi:hypothetical protein
MKREDGEKVEFAVPLRKATAVVSSDAASAFKAQVKAAGSTVATTSSKASSGQKRKKSAMELIKEEEEAKKLAKLQRLEAEVGARANRNDHWLTVGIVVKVMNKKVAASSLTLVCLATALPLSPVLSIFMFASARTDC